MRSLTISLSEANFKILEGVMDDLGCKTLSDTVLRGIGLLADATGYAKKGHTDVLFLNPENNNIVIGSKIEVKQKLYEETGNPMILKFRPMASRR
jgi:hypothetical protein